MGPESLQRLPQGEAPSTPSCAEQCALMPHALNEMCSCLQVVDRDPNASENLLECLLSVLEGLPWPARLAPKKRPRKPPSDPGGEPWKDRRRQAALADVDARCEGIEEGILREEGSQPASTRPSDPESWALILLLLALARWAQAQHDTVA